MKRIMLAALAVSGSGCAATPEPDIYLAVDMAKGHVDKPRGDNEWANTIIAYDSAVQTLPPGIFTVRVKHEAGTDPLLSVEDAHVTVHPISVCQAKPNLTCDATGACFGEAIQQTLGSCLLEIDAVVDGRDAHACWYLGTYPRWSEPSQTEDDLVHTLGCGGGSSRISANPPSS